MGNTFNPKDTFLDVPLTTYRDTLRRWTYHQDLRQVLANRKIALAPQAAAVLVNEADLAGFVQASNDFRNRLTDKGRDFINASPLKSMRRERASEIVSEILVNCGKINNRDDLCFRIDRVWLFGSYVKGASTVNDIDIVVETGRIPERSLMDSKWRDHTIELACEMGGERFVYGRVGYAANADVYLEKR